MQARRPVRLSSSLLLAAGATFILAPGSAAADPRFVATLEGSATLPIAAPDTSLFGAGAAAAGSVGFAFDDTLGAALRLEGGVLSDGSPPGNHFVDPGVGHWVAATLDLRVRPFGDLFGDHRRTTGPVLELGLGGAVTGDLVRPALSGSVGWGIEVGDVVLVPSVGVTHVVAWDDPMGGVGALVGRAGLALVFGDTGPAAVAEAAVPVGDRDGDGLRDPDDFCPDEPEDLDDFEDDDGCPDLDDDGDGIPDRTDACPRVPEDLDGDHDDDGCPEEPPPDLDRDHDGFLDSVDACPDDPEVINGVLDDDGCPDEGLITLIGDRVVLDDRVLFDFAHARVRSGARPLLASVVTMFRAHPQWDRLRVEGHTDERGDEAYNQELSERRAAAVRAVLVQLGLPASRIEIAAYGESRLYDYGDTEESHARNRRVELVMIDDVEVVPDTPTPAPSAPATPIADDEEEGATTLARVDGGSR